MPPRMESKVTTRAAVTQIDIIEKVAEAEGWDYDRSNDNELRALVDGQFADYQLEFTWMPDIDVLHLACGAELKIPQHRHAEVQALATLYNESLWVGHFDFWAKEGMVMHRQSMPLPAGIEIDPAQIFQMVGTALAHCEEALPAFNFVVWGGQSAQEAYSASRFETQGTA